MHTEHELVVEQLQAAFSAREIDADGAFAQWGMTYSDGDEYTKHVTGKRWNALDRGYLDLRSDALGFMNTALLVAVLPAYLQQLLEGGPFSQVPDMLLLTLTKPGPERGSRLGKKRFDELVDALSEPQRAAVAAVIDRFAKEHPDTLHASAAKLALDLYWQQFIKKVFRFEESKSGHEQAITGKQNARDNCKSEAP